MKRIVLLFLLLFLLLNIIGAQTITLKGRVVYTDSADALPFCSIILNDTAVYKSDLSGNFQIILDSNVYKCNLDFKYVGFERLQVINIPLSTTDVNLGDIPLNSSVISFYLSSVKFSSHTSRKAALI